jgi:hypothetical protein
MTESFEGGCACRAVRYRMTRRPMIVHGCHCTWCQRETGSAFAVNALVETDRVVVQGEVEAIVTPSASGQGQRIARCPACKIALWSHYAGAGPTLRFVRVGTLDNPGQFPPDIHIFTSTRQAWVVLPPGVPAFAEFYNPKEQWSAESQARWKAAKSSTPARDTGA